MIERKKYFENNGITEVDVEMLATAVLQKMYCRNDLSGYPFIRTTIIEMVFDPFLSLNTIQKKIVETNEGHYDYAFSVGGISSVCGHILDQIRSTIPTPYSMLVFGLDIGDPTLKITVMEFVCTVADFIYLTIRAYIDGTNIANPVVDEELLYKLKINGLRK